MKTEEIIFILSFLELLFEQMRKNEEIARKLSPWKKFQVFFCLFWDNNITLFLEITVSETKRKQYIL